MRHGSLFSGMGGFDVAAEWMGWENVFHCEINTFCQRILKYYWPNAELFTDITKSTFSKYRGTIDILTGGFPCQPYSIAGKRKGTEDNRHLWPENFRAIREIQPRWIVGENVHGIINWSKGLVFHEVQTDLETAGYEVWPVVLPACSVGADHQRYRTWFIAHASGTGMFQQREGETVQNINRNNQDEERGWIKQQVGTFGSIESNTKFKGLERGRGPWQGFEQRFKINDWSDRPTQSPFCERDDGLSSRLDGITFPNYRNESIKAAGNAIVPQVALQIFKTIEQYEDAMKTGRTSE